METKVQEIETQSSRKPLIAANWKMNGSKKDVEEFMVGLNGLQCDFDIVFAPPFPYLQLTKSKLETFRNACLHLSAQNVSEKEKGSFTGEVSAQMLDDIGCDYVIIGHSERRALYHESEESILDKVKQSLFNNLVPIICIGESLSDYQNGNTDEILNRQLSTVIDNLDLNSLAKIVIAYEPVWAIGTGKIPELDEIEKIHQNIRFKFDEKSVKIANSLRIVYGGSVNPTNAESVFACANVDGGLIGGASLDFFAFEQIIKAFK